MMQKKIRCAPKTRVSELTAFYDTGWVNEQKARTEAEIFGSDEPPKRDMTRLVREAYNTCLTETQRRYFVAYFIRGMKMYEIAKQYHVSESTVSRTITRAKRRMERILHFAVRQG